MIHLIPLTIKKEISVVVIVIIGWRLRRKYSSISKTRHRIVAHHVINSHACTWRCRIGKIVFPIMLVHPCCFKKIGHCEFTGRSACTDHIIIQLNHTKVVVSVPSEIHVCLTIIINKSHWVEQPAVKRLNSRCIAIYNVTAYRIFKRTDRAIGNCHTYSTSTIPKIEVKLSIPIGR
ncbi:hypothetical protein MYP_2164 [Sporocytophaga myxococcoides]|uniref:Uncharacterized protein n=1 Tax=Sporocytophaga myxococcoides TaxID=153721 RepID=A0A098LES8_9BACT|nr:hypothetical protein MYP_2164 [Sporocytophaga myxococcoides]